MLALALSLFLAQEPDLVNGSLAEWKGGRPVGWTIGQGAGNRSGSAVSLIEKVVDGGACLRGDANTGRWLLLSQSLPLGVGDAFRLSFEARAFDLRQEGDQWPSHHVGMSFFDEGGESRTPHRRRIASEKWTDEEIVGRVPAWAKRADVQVLLSMSGTLEVRNFHIERLKPEQSFEVLVRHMDRYYSYFDHREIDWAGVVSRHEKGSGTFVERIVAMLGELRDPHVVVSEPGGKQLRTWTPELHYNFSHEAVISRLREVKQIGRNSFVGRTEEGFGYLAVGSLIGDGAVFDQLEAAVGAMLDVRGFLVDLRANGGGWEANAIRVGALFCDKERVYARVCYRSGPVHDAFTPAEDRSIKPREGATFTGPVICLIGGACVSSGEALALMFKSMPHATLLGQPTQGASGNPQPVVLPNGVRITFSRWVAMRPDGSVYEGEGVQPDILVAHEKEGDSTFEAAIEELKKRLK